MKNEKTISVSDSVGVTVKYALVQEVDLLNKWLRRSKLALEKIEECEDLRKENKQLKKENKALKI